MIQTFICTRLQNFALLVVTVTSCSSYALNLDFDGRASRDNSTGIWTVEMPDRSIKQFPNGTTKVYSNGTYDNEHGETVLDTVTIKPNQKNGGGKEKGSRPSKGNDDTTGSAADPDATAAAQRCESAYKRTKVACNGIVFSSIAQQVLGQYQASKESGNLKAACEKAAKLNKIGGLLNAAFAVTCQQAQSSCVSSCNKADESGAAMVGTLSNDEKLYYCQEKGFVAQISTLQVAMNASQFLGSQACADAASGKCIGDESFNDIECIQFCQKPGRQEHPKCKQTIASCGDATYRSQNSQMCNCLSNLSAPGCGGLQIPTIDIPTIANDTTDPFKGLDDFPGVDEFTGNAANLGAGSKVDGGAGGGGGGFGGGSGGSAPFGQNDGQSEGGDDPLNKDILGGQGGGSGVAGGGGGGGGYESSGGSGSGRGRGGSEKDSPGFDLRAFLPGGKKDPKRGIASTGYSDATITPANGLSNFEKVTRRINQKQPELMP